MTYPLGSEEEQYRVIAAGGHAVLGTPLDDALLPFALL